MNFYDKHIGDYIKQTAHLSLLEHGVYNRLLDVYYTFEEAPLDDKVARLIGARTREEKDALKLVLEEFFELRDGRWHKNRCDEEIEAYVAGEPEREVKKANEDNRTKRHREERAKLFQVITAAGQHAAWNAPIADLRAMAERLTATGPATPTPTPETQPETQPVTAPATPVTATHSPVPSTQYPEVKEKTPPTPKPPSEPHGFVSFWAAWPSNDRKGGKAKCLEVWKRRKLEHEAERIVAHVEAMKGTAKWHEDGGAYVPMPATYLNGRRWDGAELNGHGASDLYAGAL